MTNDFTERLILKEQIHNNKNDIFKYKNIISNLEIENKKFFEELGKIEFERFEDFTEHKELKFIYFETERKLIFSGSIFKDTAKTKINQNIKNKLFSKKNGNYKTYWNKQNRVWEINNIEKENLKKVCNIIKQYLKKYIDDLEIKYV